MSNRNNNIKNPSAGRTKRFLIAMLGISIASILIFLGCFAKIITDSKIGLILIHSFRLVFFDIKYFNPVEVVTVTLKNLKKIYFALGMKSLLPFAVAGIFYLIATAILGIVNRYLMNRTTTLHGSSRWATREELLSTGLISDRGIVFGQTNDAQYKEESVPRPNFLDCKNSEDWQEKVNAWKPTDTVVKLKKKGDLLMEYQNAHVLVVGSTRSGKGVNTVIPTNFMWPDSMIIFDPKYEAWKIASNHRSKFSYCFKLDPAHPKESIHYNPLLSIKRDNVLADLQNLGIILIPDEQKDPFWTQQARRLFVACCGYILYCLPPSQKNFKSLNQIFSASLHDTRSYATEEEKKEEEEKYNQVLNKLQILIASTGDPDKQKEFNDRLNELTKQHATSVANKSDWLRLLESANKGVSSDFIEKISEQVNKAEQDYQDKRAAQIESSSVKQCLDKYARKVREVKESKRRGNEEEYAEFSNRFSLSKEERLGIERKYEDVLFEEDIKALDGIEKELLSFKATEDRELSSIVSTMNSKTIVITDPKVQEITATSDFAFEDFVEGVPDETGRLVPISLYLTAELGDIQRLMPLFKIFFEQAIKTLTRELDSERQDMMRTNKGKPRKFKLLLMFDEFPQMDKVDAVLRALSISAGYGIVCCMIIQSFEQLKLIYKSKSVIADNCMYTLILRVNDLSTCEEIEKDLAKTTEKRVMIQSSGKMFELAHLSESEQVSELGRSLMTADEIRTMPDEDCILFCSGTHPYKAKKIRYYMDPRFSKFYLDKEGNQLPPAKLSENYPHASESSVYGLDREGWMLIGKNIEREEQRRIGYDEEVIDIAEGTADLSDETYEEDLNFRMEHPVGFRLTPEANLDEVLANINITANSVNVLETEGQRKGEDLRKTAGFINQEAR